jgi:acetolactate synthase-1/2/3 large subunit
MGDGTFMYNPIVQSLALSKQEGLPVLIVIGNNGGYLAMKQEHHAFYPEGDSAAHDIYPGHPVTGFDYESLAGVFGFHGRRVEDPAELPGAIREAQAAVEDGRTAILNVAIGS